MCQVGGKCADRATDAPCAEWWQVWLYFLGFVLTWASLFAKLWRITALVINPTLQVPPVSLAAIKHRPSPRPVPTLHTSNHS